MFALVLAIIAIALVVAVFALGQAYGGDKLTDAQATAEAVRLRTEDQQIMAAVDMFNADKRRFPQDIQELVTERYLLSVPRGARSATEVQAQARQARVAPPPAASGWSVPVTGAPIILTETTVPREVCRRYNQVARGDDGILKQVMEGLQAQCYGRDDVYRIVVSKGSLPALITAVDPDEVLTGGVPAASTGVVWWDTLPAGAILVEVDPAKVPYAKLVLSAGTMSFGPLQVGLTKNSPLHTISNTGNIASSGLTFELPTGYSLGANSCSTGIQAGSSCTFSVRFAPTDAGAYETSIAVSSSNADEVRLAVEGEGRSASASLADVSFGELASGSRHTLAATLKNTGIGPLTIGSPVVTGAGFSAVGGSCASSLAAAATCTIQVELVAAGLQDHAGTLTIPTLEAGSFQAKLTGHSQQAILAVSPAAHDFGSVQIGQSKDSALSTVRNTGNIPLLGLAVGELAPFTRQGGSCGASLAPGASCDVSFRFSPQAAGAARENIAISSSNAGNLAIALSGQGLVQSATLTGGAFGSVASGSSLDQMVTLSNPGVGPLSVTVPAAANVTGAGFAFVSTSCSTSLAAGQSCTISLRFTATGVVSAAGTLAVATGAGTKSVPLSGVSQQGVLSVTPKNYAFGSVQVGQSASSATHTLTNSGNLGITGLVLTAPAGFTLASNGCTATLAPAASCSFGVTFTPASAAGYNANLTITSTNAVGTSVTLTGTGTAPAASLTGIAFGNRTAGATTDLASTLTNTGVAPISVAPPSAGSVTGAGFSFLGSTCGTTLAANASCTISVRYTATRAAAAAGTLTVSTGAGAKSAALTGQSLAAVATVISGSSMTLADWYQPGNSTNAFTLRNDGNQPLTLTATGLSGPLSLAGNSCNSVAPGATCALTVAMNRSSPGGSGVQNLNVAGGVQGSFNLPVTWYVHTAVPRWSTTALNFGNVTVGQAASATIYLFNDGSVAYNWTAAVANNPPGFTFNMSACSNVVPGGACAVQVTFAPGSAGGFGGSWVVVPAYSYYSNLLSVSGTGVSAAPPPVSVNQFAVSLPNGGGDDWYVTIANNSGQNVTVVAVEFSGTYDEYVYAVIGGRQYGHTYNSYDWCCRFDGAATWAAGSSAVVRYDIQNGYTSMMVTLSNGQVLAFYIPQAG